MGLAFFADDPGIFMSYWYGGLYVVIEGWKELGLHDPEIDQLIEPQTQICCADTETVHFIFRSNTSTSDSRGLWGNRELLHGFAI